MTALVDAERPQRRRQQVLVGGALLVAVLLISAVVTAAARSNDEPLAASAGAGTTASSGAASDSPVRTEDGAVSAAVGFLQAYGSPEMYDPQERRQIIADITSPARRDQVAAQVDEAFTLAAQNLGLNARGRSPAGELIARTVPVGVRTLAYTDDRAVISVWTMGLLGVAGLESRLPVQESWSTETVTLEWTAEGWRWVSLEHVDGPAPIGSAQVPADAAVIADAAREFGEVTHAR